MARFLNSRPLLVAFLFLGLALGSAACGGKLNNGGTHGRTGGAGGGQGSTSDSSTEKDDGSCTTACAATEYCKAKVCLPRTVLKQGCDDTTNPCPVGYTCNTTASPARCEKNTTCAYHSDCVDAEVCIGNKCVVGTRCQSSGECKHGDICSGGACVSLGGGEDLCATHKLTCGAKEKCENNRCVPDCVSPCGGVCCDASDVCYKDKCVTPCNSGEEMCGDPSSRVCCNSATDACLSGACRPKGVACNNTTSFCTTVRYCDAHYMSCIKYTDNPDLCKLPTVPEFELVEKLTYDNPTNLPAYNQSIRIPLVADVTGPGGVPDGEPDIIVNMYQSYGGKGVLRVIRGKTRDPNDPKSVIEYWDSTEASQGIGKGFYLNSEITPAVGDLDGDGKPDIVFADSSGYVRAVHGGNGKPLWTSSSSTSTWDAFAIADLDHDGKPEVLFGSNVLNGQNGHLLCSLGTTSATPIAADLDETGNMEIVSGKATYSFVRKGIDLAECKPRLIDPSDPHSIPSSYGAYNDNSAVADVDERYPGPEIINISGGYLYLLTSRGKEIWKYKLPSGSAGPPTVADFDGDERLEVATADSSGYTITKPWDPVQNKYRPHKLWLEDTYDQTSGVTGSSIFDFDGDGKAEAVYNDEQYLRIYDGATGNLRMRSVPNVVSGQPTGSVIRNTSITDIEYPVIADVDLDGHADIVVVANEYGADPKTKGVRVFTDKDNRWVATRSIWNQHTYHYTNVNDDGTIPRNEKPHWKEAWSNTFRQNMQKGNSSLAPNVVVKLGNLYNASCNSVSDRKISYTITNVGDAPIKAGSIVTEVSVSETGKSTYTTVKSSKNSKALAKGESEEVSFDWNIPAGLANKALDIKVVADSTKQIIECKEDDNTDIKTNVTVAAPNLIPVIPSESSSFTCAPSSTSKAKITFELHNSGGAPVAAQTVDVKVTLTGVVNNVKKTIDKVFAKVNKNKIDPKGFETITLELPVDSGNVWYDAKIEVDPADTITECLESDNVYTSTAGAVACRLLG